jgi:hypothetical protein
MRPGGAYLDVSARQIILGHDKLVQVNVVRKTHLARVDLEDAALCGEVWHGELNFAVNAAGAKEGGVQRLDPVGCQQHLDIATRVEPVELRSDKQCTTGKRIQARRQTHART